MKWLWVMKLLLLLGRLLIAVPFFWVPFIALHPQLPPIPPHSQPPTIKGAYDDDDDWEVDCDDTGCTSELV